MFYGYQYMQIMMWLWYYMYHIMNIYANSLKKWKSNETCLNKNWEQHERWLNSKYAEREFIPWSLVVQSGDSQGVTNLTAWNITDVFCCCIKFFCSKSKLSSNK